MGLNSPASRAVCALCVDLFTKSDRLILGRARMMSFEMLADHLYPSLAPDRALIMITPDRRKQTSAAVWALLRRSA